MESSPRFTEIVRRVEISIHPATLAEDITREQVLKLMKSIGTTDKERLLTPQGGPLAKTHQAVQNLRKQKATQSG